MNRLSFSRRRFLQGASAMAAWGALPGVQVMRSARAEAAAPTTLVVVHLSGGNDTLNTVIPYKDPNYYAIRTQLAVPAAQVLPLNDRQGLHPSLTGIKQLYDARKVAIVNAVGYPSFDYSHFEAMEIYWTADPARVSSNGWLGNALDRIVAAELASGGAPDVLSGTAIGLQGARSLTASSFTAPVLSSRPEWYSLPARGVPQRDALSRVLQQPLTGTNLLRDALLRNSRAALQAYNTVQTAGGLTTPVTYAEDNFAQSLKFAAQLLRADSDIRVITLSQGSYDTHENQYAWHARELAELSAAIKVFVDDLEAQAISDRVVILLWSEFARRIRPNASLGTDHGSAQALFLIGDGVRGGVVGEPPKLTQPDILDGRNLKMQYDFRQVYATLLSGWLGVDATAVLGAGWGALPVLL
jgi:uncharacterized protein (DUF1501 family)